jgi:hypothetical protein
LADFNGGKITSDTGALLLRQVDKRIGLIDAVSSCIPDPRNPSFTKHDQRAMLAQRIYAIAMGYEDAVLLGMSEQPEKSAFIVGNCDFELKNGSGFCGRGFIAGARFEPTTLLSKL